VDRAFQRGQVDAWVIGFVDGTDQLLRSLEADEAERGWISPFGAPSVCSLLLLTLMLNYLDRQTLSLTIVPISDELGLSNTQYGMLEKGFIYAFAVGGLAAGWLADNVSVRWLYPLVLFARSAAGRHCQAASRHCQAAPPCLPSGTEGRSVPRSFAPDTSCPLGTAART